MALKSAGATWWLVRAWFVMVVVFFAGIVFATPLPYRDTKGKYSFEISVSDEDVVIFELKGSKDVETASVFSMAKPERIIVDLPTGRSLNWFRNIVVQRGSVQRIRVGSHDAKVRFVLDISRTAKGAYDVSNTGGVLRIRVRGSEKKGPSSMKEQTKTPSAGGAARENLDEDRAAQDDEFEHSEITSTATPKTVLSPTPTRTLRPTKTPRPTNTIKPTNTVKPTRTLKPTNTVKPTFTSVERPTVSVESVFTPLPTDTPTRTPTIEASATDIPTPVPTALEIFQDRKAEETSEVFPTLASIEISPTPVAGQSDAERKVKLLSLGYEMSDKGEPCLRLKFSRVVSYQMVRSSQDLFVVTIDNVGLQDPSLSLAHFPPAAFSRFVSARAQSEKNGLKIFIYIEKGSYLLSIPKGSEIWLKAYGGDTR